MSYCRWSSDDFQCDVYVYEDCAGGWTTHLANMRKVFKEPLPEFISFEKKNQKEWFERHKKVMKMCAEADLVPIDLPFDGESFNHNTPRECADWLIELKKTGYNVPQYAIDSLIEESSPPEKEQ